MIADEGEDWAESIHLEPTINQLKDRAHQSFDPLWRHQLVTRKQAYWLLATALGVPEEEAHMTVMSRENLVRVPLICRALFLRLQRLRRAGIDPVAGSG